MPVFLRSFRTSASRTSSSSLDHPSPFSLLGRVNTARLNAESPERIFSRFQMPISASAIIVANEQRGR